MFCTRTKGVIFTTSMTYVLCSIAYVLCLEQRINNKCFPSFNKCRSVNRQKLNHVLHHWQLLIDLNTLCPGKK